MRPQQMSLATSHDNGITTSFAIASALESNSYNAGSTSLVRRTVRRLKRHPAQYVERVPPLANTATERTLAVYELLEMILLQLPPIDLLLASRVSKTFRDVIGTSLSCRRALFLEPMAYAHLYSRPTLIRKWIVRPPQLNLLIGTFYKTDANVDDEGFFRSFYEHQGTSPTAQHALSCPQATRVPVLCHGDLCQADTERQQALNSGRIIAELPHLSKLNADQMYVHIPAIGSTGWSRFSRAIRFEKASWRKMYITQPPLPFHLYDHRARMYRGQLPPLKMGVMMPLLFTPRALNGSRFRKWQAAVWCSETEHIEEPAFTKNFVARLESCWVEWLVSNIYPYGYLIVLGLFAMWQVVLLLSFAVRT